MEISRKLKLTQKTVLLMGVGLMSQLANADIVQNDDVIVEGSLCVSDSDLCANGESFNATGAPNNPHDLKIKDGVPQIWISDSDASESDWVIGVDHAGTPSESLSFWNEESDSFPFVLENGVATNNMLVIDSNERVGIGTGAPGQRLEVASTSGPAIRIHDTTAGDGHVDLYQQARHFVIKDEIGTNRFAIETDGATATVGHDQVYLDNDGDVSFGGIANPAHALHVKHDGSDYLVMDGTTQDWAWYVGNSYMSLNNHTTGDFGFRIYNDNTGDDTMVLRGNNVGIGTISPTASVHVNDTATDMFLLNNTNATTQYRTLFKATNKGAVGFEIEDRDQAVKWQFRTNTAGEFLINEQAVAGSEFKISPTGNALFSGRVTADAFRAGTTFLNVPDYVFASDYKLMPLDEVQAFITKNKHLPNVPSESEIKKAKSLDIGSTQMKHLEKIEELTLYTLQQHEQIKALQKKSDGFQQQLSDQTMALKSENNRLLERLASLEKLVTNLASAGNNLKEKGEKVALNNSLK